jgi:hypothetical protein
VEGEGIVIQDGAGLTQKDDATQTASTALLALLI